MAIDVSNFTAVPTPEQLACLRDAGHDYAIVGTQRPGITRMQLQAFSDAGFRVDAYVFLYWQSEIEPQIVAALDAIRGFPVGRLWLDCEDTTYLPDAEKLVSFISRAVQACSDFPHGIYTGRWWWPHTGDTTIFSDLPLWHAEYARQSGDKPSPGFMPDFDGFQGYGGWPRPAVWQYAGSVRECGLNVDLDAADPQPAPTPAPAPPDFMHQLKALIAAAFVMSIGHPLSDLSQEDRDAVRFVASQL